ncbi:MAG: uroporphyrinogen decarboxylase family protein [Promethearchaeota archaeon]
MKSKERVKKAFHFDKPDRVPRACFSLNTDFFPVMVLTSQNFQPTNYPPHLFGGLNSFKLPMKFVLKYKWKDECRKKLGLNKRWWNEKENREILTIDEWGLIWKSGAACVDRTMGHPFLGPFHDSWDNLDDYYPFDPSDETRYRFWNGLTKILSKSKYILGILNILFIHNLSSNLRGFSKIMVDFVRNPKQVHKLIKIITDIFSAEIRILKEKVPQMDAIFILDDLGTQVSPIISPRLFRKFYYEPYKEIVNLTHDLGMDIIFHCCGQIKELLPTFYELGIDTMEFDSPNMTGVENFKEYAAEQKMAFWLSSNIQSTYSLGTPKDIEEEVKYFVEQVGNNRGGLGFYEYLDYKVLNAPKKNVKAFRKAMKKWGKYNNNGVIDWLA